MKRLFVLLLVVLAAVAARATPPTQVAEVQFEEIRSDLLQLEGLLADSGSFLTNLAASPEAPEAMEFGSWEIHGEVEAAEGGYRGKNLRCRFGDDVFHCDGQIVIESGATGRMYTGMLLDADSLSINHLIPGWARSLRRSLASISEGRARIGMVRSVGPGGDSVVHRYEALWSSKGGTMESDSASLLGGFFIKMMKALPYPFASDQNRPSWKVLESTVAIRYFPSFYSAEDARRKLGDSRKLQEMVVSLEITVEVPRQFLFLRFPHRYRLKLDRMPLRLYESRMSSPPAS
jgi:hypothetical protein